MSRILGILVATTVLVVSCGTTPDVGAPIGIDGPWQLVSGSHSGTAIQPISSHPVTLNIDGNMIGGTAACNGYGGEWVKDGSSVTFGDVAHTEMACEPVATMDLERAYLDALLAVTTIAVEDGQLVLTGPDVELRFDELQPPPTAQLLGTVWVLDSLVQGDAVSSVSGGPTLEFFTDGSFLATTGCRNITGNYVESGAGITTTQMQAQGECADELGDQDSHIISVLEGEYRANIEGQTLTLMIAGESGLVYKATQQS